MSEDAQIRNDAEFTGAEWVAAHAGDTVREIDKPTAATRAWFAVIDGRESFAKWYPPDLRDTWAATEAAISGAGLHPAILPLRRRVDVADGALLLYDRAAGENLGDGAARARFYRLPVGERAAAVLDACAALAAIHAAGWMVVDWYFGNTLYDFDARRVRVFDWELCRPGGSFVLEMDSNYGSSRLMAPEEFVRGSVLDGATLVFNLGRFALLLLPELADPLAPVLARATYPARAGRHPTPAAFVADLRDALMRVPNHTPLPQGFVSAGRDAVPVHAPGSRCHPP